MKSHEHRSIGDAATGGALVNLGTHSADNGLLLSYGDVVALSGDFFRPHGASAVDAASSRGGLPTSDDRTGNLFSLALVPGEAGARPDSRDEIICALKVAAVDESVADRRFEPGGRFAGYRFSDHADRTEVERRVRDRYLTLAAANDDHFVVPGRSDAATGSGAGSAPMAYRRLHKVALDEARLLGHRGGDLSRAMAREAAAQHYLTDSFAAGHLRTPVADIRHYWRARYPAFWEQLQRKVAADTAKALRELSLLMRVLPSRALRRRTLSEVTARTSGYPQLSVGDLIARMFHDWDNEHGLAVESGGVVFGDGHVDEGATSALALAAVRAGIDDIEVAFRLGASGSRLGGEALYRAVREATGSEGERFLAERKVPRPAPTNPGQNWRAPDVERLWDSPVVGASGTTVGDALVAMLDPHGQFMRQVEGLGQGLSGDGGVFGVPVLGPWLGDKCCLAYHRGFVEPLAQDPKGAIMALLPTREATGFPPRRASLPGHEIGDKAPPTAVGTPAGPWLAAHKPGD